MKKLVGVLLFLFCLSLPPWLGAQTPVFGIELDRFFEANITDFPAAPPTGTIRIALDGASGSDCVTGSGSIRVICRWAGSVWESLGGGAGGSTTWVGLTDTAGSITALECVRGNAGATALEFITCPGGGAPTGATYITQIPDAGLSAEQPLDALASGIMRSDTATGVVTTLTTSADIAANVSDMVGNAGGIFRGTMTSPAVDDLLCIIGISPTVLGNCTLNLLIANEGATGTTINHLVKLTGAPSTVINTAAGDTGGAIGVCVAGCGTTGNAEIRVAGIVPVDMDGATTAGNYVEISNSVVGEGTDAGSSYPTAEQVVCRVTQTIGAAGLADCLLFPGESRDVGGGGGAVPIVTGHGRCNYGSGSTYFPFGGGGNLPCSGTETDSRQSLPRAGTVANLYVHIIPALASGENVTFWVVDVGARSAVTCSITGNGSITECNNTANSYAASAGDDATVEFQVTGTALGTHSVHWTFTFDN
ncbi:MAG: hypothetical protein V3S55_13885 [Nitrospiraceae bacterium]